MRVVFFGTNGAYSERHFLALVPVCDIVGVVVASRPRRGLVHSVKEFARWVGAGPRGALIDAAEQNNVPWVETRARQDGGFVRVLERWVPDLICIAVYPWVLPSEVINMPRFGAINSHPSLLPRHRGVLPLFWVYYHDDRVAGATVHRVTDSVDAGDVMVQHSRSLPRGFPVDRLYDRLASDGAGILAEAVRLIESGTAPRVRQDERCATTAPWVRAGTPMVQPAWSVERTWHFLTGCYPRFREPLTDESGRRVVYRGVDGFEEFANDAVPGTVERRNRGAVLNCVDGVVRLAI